QVAALAGELIFVALGALGVANSLEDALLDQPVQAVGQDVAGDAQALLEVIEAAQAEKRVADDQQRPALADDLERAGDRAVLSVIVTLQHAFQSIVSISCFTQPGQVASATRGPPCSPATACPGLGFGSLNQP